MFPVYEEKKENLHFRSKTSRHASPHLHNSIEFIYITEGTLELGMGQELYHMDKGDFAVIFPDVIHHYQVFSPGINRGWYLWAGMTLTGQFADTIQKSCPDNPVITSKNLHPDIRNAVKCLYDNKKEKIRTLLLNRRMYRFCLQGASPVTDWRKRALWRAVILSIRQYLILQNILRNRSRWNPWQKIWG